MTHAAPRFVRSDRVLWRRTAHVVITRRLDGETLTLTGTGPALWDALDRPRTLDELSRLLADGFGVSPGRVAEDIEPVLSRLEADGVVRVLR